MIVTRSLMARGAGPIARLRVLFAFLVAAVSFAGVARAHIEADGFIVTTNGLPVIHVWQGVVSGSFVVPFGQSTDRFDVAFLDPDSVLFTPGPAGDTWLKYLNENPGAVQIDSLGAWAFSMEGLQNGATGNIRLRVWFENHFDFTSPPLPFRVASPAEVGDGTVSPALLGIFPNPMRASSSIRFDLPMEASVVISLHDTSGRLVRELASGTFAQGPHEVGLERADLEAGVYFLRLQTPRGVVQSKVQVVK